MANLPTDPRQEAEYYDTRTLVNIYKRYPQYFKPHQVDELSVRAKTLGIEFQRHEEGGLISTIGDYIGALGTGFLEGFTALPIAEEPQGVGPQIVKSIGHLAGFAGMLFPGLGAGGAAFGGLKKLAFAVGETTSWGQRIMKTANMVKNMRSVPMLAGDVVTARLFGGKAGEAALQVLQKSPIQEQMLRHAIHLGTASAVSDLHAGVDRAVVGGLFGAAYGGIFAAVGNLPFAKGEASLDKMFRGIAGSLAQGLPSTIQGQPVADQIYNYLLGYYFGGHTRTAEQDQAVRWITQFKDPMQMMAANMEKGFEALPKETQKQVVKFQKEWFNNQPAAAIIVQGMRIMGQNFGTLNKFIDQTIPEDLRALMHQEFIDTRNKKTAENVFDHLEWQSEFGTDSIKEAINSRVESFLNKAVGEGNYDPIVKDAIERYIQKDIVESAQTARETGVDMWPIFVKNTIAKLQEARGPEGKIDTEAFRELRMIYERERQGIDNKIYSWDVNRKKLRLLKPDEDGHVRDIDDNVVDVRTAPRLIQTLTNDNDVIRYIKHAVDTTLPADQGRKVGLKTVDLTPTDYAHMNKEAEKDGYYVFSGHSDNDYFVTIKYPKPKKDLVNDYNNFKGRAQPEGRKILRDFEEAWVKQGYGTADDFKAQYISNVQYDTLVTGLSPAEQFRAMHGSNIDPQVLLRSVGEKRRNLARTMIGELEQAYVEKMGGGRKQQEGGYHAEYEGSYAGYGASTFPYWFKDLGFSKEKMLAALRAFVAGKPMGKSKEAKFVDEFTDAALLDGYETGNDVYAPRTFIEPDQEYIDLVRELEMGGKVPGNKKAFIGNALEFNKRIQVMFNSAYALNPHFFDRPIKYAIIDEGIEGIEMPPEMTDGAVLVTRKLADQALASTGLPATGAYFKPFITDHNPTLGTMLGKEAWHIASPALEAAMEAAGIDMMRYTSATKQQGKRFTSGKYKLDNGRLAFYREGEEVKPDLYDLAPENVRAVPGVYDDPRAARKGARIPVSFIKTMFPEVTGENETAIRDLAKWQIEQARGTPNSNSLVSSYSKDPKPDKLDAIFTKSKRSGRAPIENAGVAEILEAYQDRPFRERLRRFLLNDYEDVVELEDGLDARESTPTEKASMKMMRLGDGSDASAIARFSRDVHDELVGNFLIGRYIRPMVRSAGKGFMRVADAGMGPVEENKFYLDDGWKEMQVKGVDSRGASKWMTLEEQWNLYQKTTNADIKESMEKALEAAVTRTPQSDWSGVARLGFGGFTGVRGTGGALHGKVMRRLGGADLDSDTFSFFFGMPESVLRVADHNAENLTKWQTSYGKGADGIDNPKKLFIDEETKANLPHYDHFLGKYSPMHRLQIGHAVSKGRGYMMGMAVNARFAIGSLYSLVNSRKQKVMDITLRDAGGKDKFATEDGTKRIRLYARGDGGDLFRALSYHANEVAVDIGKYGNMVDDTTLRATLLAAAFPHAEEVNQNGDVIRTLWGKDTLQVAKKRIVNGKTEYTPFRFRPSEELLDFADYGGRGIKPWEKKYDGNLLDTPAGEIMRVNKAWYKRDMRTGERSSLIEKAHTSMEYPNEIEIGWKYIAPELANLKVLDLTPINMFGRTPEAVADDIRDAQRHVIGKGTTLERLNQRYQIRTKGEDGTIKIKEAPITEALHLTSKRMVGILNAVKPFWKPGDPARPYNLASIRGKAMMSSSEYKEGEAFKTFADDVARGLGFKDAVDMVKQEFFGPADRFWTKKGEFMGRRADRKFFVDKAVEMAKDFATSRVEDLASMKAINDFMRETNISPQIMGTAIRVADQIKEAYAEAYANRKSGDDTYSIMRQKVNQLRGVFREAARRYVEEVKKRQGNAPDASDIEMAFDLAMISTLTSGKETKPFRKGWSLVPDKAIRRFMRAYNEAYDLMRQPFRAQDVKDFFEATGKTTSAQINVVYAEDRIVIPKNLTTTPEHEKILRELVDLASNYGVFREDSTNVFKVMRAIYGKAQPMDYTLDEVKGFIEMLRQWQRGPGFWNWWMADERKPLRKLAERVKLPWFHTLRFVESSADQLRMADLQLIHKGVWGPEGAIRPDAPLLRTLDGGRVKLVYGDAAIPMTRYHQLINTAMQRDVLAVQAGARDEEELERRAGWLRRPITNTANGQDDGNLLRELAILRMEYDYYKQARKQFDRRTQRAEYNKAAALEDKYRERMQARGQDFLDVKARIYTTTREGVKNAKGAEVLDQITQDLRSFFGDFYKRSIKLTDEFIVKHILPTITELGWQGLSGQKGVLKSFSDILENNQLNEHLPYDGVRLVEWMQDIDARVRDRMDKEYPVKMTEQEVQELYTPDADRIIGDIPMLESLRLHSHDYRTTFVRALIGAIDLDPKEVTRRIAKIEDSIMRSTVARFGPSDKQRGAVNGMKEALRLIEEAQLTDSDVWSFPEVPAAQELATYFERRFRPYDPVKNPHADIRTRLFNMTRYSQYEMDLEFAREMKKYAIDAPGRRAAMIKWGRFREIENNPFYTTGEIEGYWPHMNFDLGALKKSIAKELAELKRDAQRGVLSPQDFTAALEDLRADEQAVIYKDRSGDMNNNVGTAQLLTKADPTPSQEHLQRLGTGRATGNVLKREMHFDGYSREMGTVVDYVKKMNNAIYGKLSAILHKEIIDSFERDPDMKAKLGGMHETWARDMRLYVRDTMGYPSIFTDEYLKDKNYELRRTPYYWLSDQYAFEKGTRAFKLYYKLSGAGELTPVEKEILRNKLQREPTKEEVMAAINAKEKELLTPTPQNAERAGYLLRNMAGIEARYEMATLLFHSKTAVANILGGTINTAILNGIGPIRQAKSMRYWNGITGGELRTQQDIDKWVISTGVIEDFMLREGNLLANRFSKGAWEKAQQEIIAKLKKDPNMDDTGIGEILKRNGITDKIMDTAGWFMRKSERRLRIDSFLAAYVKAREMFGGAGAIKYDNPYLIDIGKKGMEMTQFLYGASTRPMFARTNLGQVFSRFKLWAWSSARYRRQLMEQARFHGWSPASEAGKRVQRYLTAELFMLALASLLPHTIFDSGLPAPLSYLQDAADWLFGNSEERERAFFAQSTGLPQFLAPLNEILPPVARIPKGIWDLPSSFATLLSGDVHKLGEYTSYTLFPFGRFSKDLLKSLDSPSMTIDFMVGLPLHRADRAKKQIEKKMKIGASLEADLADTEKKKKKT